MEPELEDELKRRQLAELRARQGYVPPFWERPFGRALSSIFLLGILGFFIVANLNQPKKPQRARPVSETLTQVQIADRIRQCVAEGACEYVARRDSRGPFYCRVATTGRKHKCCSQKTDPSDCYSDFWNTPRWEPRSN